jgi:hypothetical protein
MAIDKRTDNDLSIVQQEEAEAARQEVLELLGVMGAYVAPSMTVLMSSKATAQFVSSGSTL